MYDDNPYLDYLVENKLPGLLLKEFIVRKKWSAAAIACENQIADLKYKTELLQALKDALEKEGSTDEQ